MNRDLLYHVLCLPMHHSSGGERNPGKKSSFFRKPALARHGCGSNSRGGGLGMFACTPSLLQLRQHLLSTSAVAATGCLGTVHRVVQLFAWVVNSRARLANSEGLFRHSESNHRGNSIMRKPRHTFHHLAAPLCLLFLPRPPSSPLSLLLFLSFLFFITHISSCVTHTILFAPSLTPFLSFPLSPGFS